jgi:hypothetical protein
MCAAFNSSNLNWRDAGAAFAGGFIVGAVGVVAGPLAGTVAREVFHVAASSTIRAWGGAAINAAVGAGTTKVEGAIAGRDVGTGQMVLGAGSNVAAGFAVGLAKMEPQGFTTMSQSRFMPSTISGLAKPNGQAVITGSAFGTGTAFTVTQMASESSAFQDQAIQEMNPPDTTVYYHTDFDPTYDPNVMPW